MYGFPGGREPKNRELTAYRKSPEYKMGRAQRGEQRSDRRPDWLRAAVEDMRETNRRLVQIGPKGR